MNKSALLLIAYLVVGALSIECPELDASKPDDAAILKELQPTSEEGAGKEDVVKLIYIHEVPIISKKMGSARIVRHKKDEPEALREHEIEQYIAYQDNPLVPGTPSPHHFAYSYGCWADKKFYYTATSGTSGHMDENRSSFLQRPPAEQAEALDKMASALLALHLAGVLHCNVQPKMFGGLDKSITIFNFKKAIRQGNEFCTKAEFGYAAPELFSPDLKTIKDVPQKFRAADYFSFGIVLIDMIDEEKKASKTILEISKDEDKYAKDEYSIQGVVISKFEDMMEKAEKLDSKHKAQRLFFLTQMKKVVSRLTKFKVDERATLLDMFPTIHCTRAALERAQDKKWKKMSQITEVFDSCTVVLEKKKHCMTTPRALTEIMERVKNKHKFLI